MLELDFAKSPIHARGSARGQDVAGSGRQKQEEVRRNSFAGELAGWRGLWGELGGHVGLFGAMERARGGGGGGGCWREAWE